MSNFGKKSAMKHIYQGYSRFPYKVRLWSEASRIVCIIPGYLGRTQHFHKLKKVISETNDFEPFDCDYDRRDSLQDIGNDISYRLKFIEEKTLDTEEKPTYDIITHSFGAMALRASQQDKEFWKNNKFGKLTMVAPVLNASAWARTLGANTMTRNLMLALAENRSPFAEELGKTWEGQPTCGVELQSKIAAEFHDDYPLDLSYFSEVLIVNSQLPFGGNPFLSGPNDGTLLLEETLINHPKVRYETYNVPHSFLVANHKVIHEIAAFHEFERFEKLEIDPETIKPTKQYPSVWPPGQKMHWNPNEYGRFNRHPQMELRHPDIPKGGSGFMPGR